MSRFWRPGSEKPTAAIVEDEEGGVLFLPTSTSSSSSSGFGYASLERQRQRLPVYKYRKAILYLVERHATTIVVGETGSGKSTQIPQYLKEAGWAEGGRLIGCTQPRRLAVQGMTMIKFLTDGVLIREMMEDPLLTKYRRKNSMLESADHLPNPEPAILSVEGKGYTVEIHYVEEPVSDYLQAAVNTVLIIHEKEPPGDILVFLTGQDDIDAAVKMLNEEIQHRGRHYLGCYSSDDLLILPLYSGLPRGDQDLIFTPTSKGKRKVVISTNIAETSLTLEGVVYVVDSGFSKQKCYNPISDIESLVVAPISKASARQRAGRAGRVRPGKCFRLYTEEFYLKEMQPEGIPEMQRSNLVSCIIQLKALGIDNILGFDWPASPSPEAMIRALEVLYSLGILDEDAKLTVPLGFQVAEIPLSVWVSMRGVKKEFDEAKLRFAAAEKKVIDIREQLVRIIKRFGIPLTSCDRDMEAVRKAIIAGAFANACHLEGRFYSHTSPTYSQNVISLKKPNIRVNPKWVIYQSLVSTDKHYMRNVIAIEPSWLTEAAPHFYQFRTPNPALH
uniref:Helicase C-terminal domain-containing protein n=1 Tax=Oryza barthii TaxID=65489 RepID=A0A0D3EL13_9ORYZ